MKSAREAVMIALTGIPLIGNTKLVTSSETTFIATITPCANKILI